MVTEYEIIYHDSTTDNEWRDGAIFDNEHDAAKWAMEHCKDGEYYFIDEKPLSSMQETVEEFFDYMDELLDGAGSEMYLS